MTAPTDSPNQAAFANIDSEWTVRDVVSRFPATVATFKAWKVEACCDAGRSLEEASQRAGVARTELIAALEARIAGQG